MHSGNKHLTGRVSKRQIEQLERISRHEKVDRSSALRKILDIGLDEYSKRKAIDEYRNGSISIGRAAEQARISIAEFYKILEDQNIPIRIDITGVKESLKSDF